MSGFELWVRIIIFSVDRHSIVVNVGRMVGNAAKTTSP